jgi:hypothetical protein
MIFWMPWPKPISDRSRRFATGTAPRERLFSLAANAAMEKI